MAFWFVGSLIDYLIDWLIIWLIDWLIEGMTRAEMILKVVMSPADPQEIFVEQYIRLVQGKHSSIFVLYNVNLAVYWFCTMET